MNQHAMRDRMVGGVIGLVVGVIGASIYRNLVFPPLHDVGGGIRGFGIGVPEIFFLLVTVLFLAFWVALIGGAVWGVGRWARRGHSPGRLEDLPADFDDWHRRAHERMNKDGADDPNRRG